MREHDSDLGGGKPGRAMVAKARLGAPKPRAQAVQLDREAALRSDNLGHRARRDDWTDPSVLPHRAEGRKEATQTA